MSEPITRVVPADHPSLAGHFPGDPLVPGVVLLEEVIAALQVWRENARVVAIPAVKFLAPLRPGQVFTTRFTASGGSLVEFECHSDGRPLARGQLKTVA